MLRKAVCVLALVAACEAGETNETEDGGGNALPGQASTPDAGGVSSGPAAPVNNGTGIPPSSSGGNDAGPPPSGTGNDSAVPSGNGSDAGSGSNADAGSGASPDAGGSTANLEKFSFFVTSLASLRELSKSQSGFGGDLRFGETGDGAGLRGADKICNTIAEKSMPGSSAKQWRAFLSTSTVNAKDRIGQGPWYDRKGRLIAQNLTALLNERPQGADTQIINDFPNEFGVPNHDPDGTGNVDNHDMLTGTNSKGTLFCPTNAANCTCDDWTSSARSGKPRVGHSWPRPGGGGSRPVPSIGGDGSMNNWMSALDEAGCAPGVSLIEMGPPIASNPTVGSGGGYGGFYCFALAP